LTKTITAQHTLATFEVPASVPVIVHDGVEEAANWIRPSLALYIGGMGAKTMNFHANLFERMGYEAEVEKIQGLYLDGKKAEAIATVPLELVEDVALVGPIAKIKDEFQKWEQTVITSLLLQTDPRMVPVIADALMGSVGRDDHRVARQQHDTERKAARPSI
jgi:hypothetical protein